MKEQELQEKIEKKDAHLRALTEMSVRMNSFRSLAELMGFVSDRTKELVEAEKVSIMLADPETEKMSIVASSGVDEAVAPIGELSRAVSVWIAAIAISSGIASSKAKSAATSVSWARAGSYEVSASDSRIACSNDARSSARR